MNPLWMGWAYLAAAVVVGLTVGALRVIAEGRRRVVEHRRSWTYRMERLGRMTRGSWE